MKIDIYERIAFNLREAQRNKSPSPPIRDEISDLGVDGAYKIQTINTHHYQNEGKRLCGRKIGLTSKSVQDQLGVSEPDYGVLFSYMALTDDETICAGDVLQPKVEAEVAFVLRRDLDMLEPNTADVIRATEFVLPAIEVVGSRIEKWNIGLLDTIADNGYGETGSRSVYWQWCRVSWKPYKCRGLARSKNGITWDAAASWRSDYVWRTWTYGFSKPWRLV